MKKDPLEVKLDKYYKELINPKKVIGRWSIVDDKLLTKIKEIKLDHINDIYSSSSETIIVAENKKQFIIIKHNYMFIAVKITNSEYGSVIEDWSLIGVNKDYLTGGKDEKLDSNKEIMKLLGFKLSRKAITDFKYFSSF
jgi:hypothetical protein